MSANYTPILEGFKESSSFKFWCQKVMPLVYDDSLSYYELLCKVVNLLNDVIYNVDGLHKNDENIIKAFSELQEYVNNYFNNLDVQTEINNKLDSMASSGKLDEIINQNIFNELNTKITDLDSKFTTENQNLDEKFTAQITNLEDELSNINNTVTDNTKTINSLSDKIKINFIGGVKDNPLGNCVIVEFYEKVMIIDFGQQTAPTAIMSFLMEKNIQKIDYAVLSHYHSDHIGGENAVGLLYLLNQTNYLDSAIFYLPHNLINWNNMVGDFTPTQNYEQTIKNALSNKGLNVVYPQEGDKLELNKFSVTFNNLLANYFSQYYSTYIDYRGVNIGTTNYNNFSMCLQIKFGEKSFLYSGDISYTAQLLNAALFINKDIIQIPHHGLEREAPNIVLTNINPYLGVICGSTFYETLQMSTPLVVQTSLIGGSLHYTTDTPYLTANVGLNSIELSPDYVELYNMPSRPVTVGGGISVPITATGETEDFNDIKNPCELLFQNTTVLNRWKNKPNLSSGGKLIVMKTTQSNSCRQFYITSTLNNNIIATRYWDQSNWSDWTYIVSQNTPS